MKTPFISELKMDALAARMLKRTVLFVAMADRWLAGMERLNQIRKTHRCTEKNPDTSLRCHDHPPLDREDYCDGCKAFMAAVEDKSSELWKVKKEVRNARQCLVAAYRRRQSR